MRVRLPLAVTVLAAHALAAQNTEPRDLVAGAITAADIARHVAVIADDSMQGRDTPSRGLELTAQYVSDQFKAVGLEPAGDSNSWVQRYPIPRHSTLGQYSTLWFVAKAKKGDQHLVGEVGYRVENVGQIDFRTGAIVASDTVLDSRAPGARGGGQGALSFSAGATGPAPVVVAGPHTLASVQQADLRDKVVVYMPFSASDSGTRHQILQRLRASNHVLIVADEDSAAFAARRRAREAHPPIVLDWYLPEARRLHRWAVYVWAPRIESQLMMAGFDIADAQTLTTPVVRPLNAIALLLLQAETAPNGPTVANVVGMLQGERSGHIVITAHMDHVGLRRGQQDSIANGADDNASGVAALLALAKAFAELRRSGVPLGRSILFAAVSGGAKDYWGSNSLLDKLGPGQVVFNLNLDRLGRGPQDSVWINGMQDVELPVKPAWLAAQQPELHLTVVDGGSSSAAASDQLAFVERMIPSLYVHRGDHGGAADTAGEADMADTPAGVDAEGEARIVRFLFALTREIANAPRTAPLRWTAEGRRQQGQIFGR